MMNPGQRQKAGEAAAETILQHRGAVLRTLKIIQETHPV